MNRIRHWRVGANLLVHDEAMREDGLGQWQARRQQHARPDDRVEPRDVLAHLAAKRRVTGAETRMVERGHVDRESGV